MGRMPTAFRSLFSRRPQQSPRRGRRAAPSRTSFESLERRVVLYGNTIATAQPLSLVPGSTRTDRGAIGDESGAADVDVFVVDLLAADRLVIDIDARETGLSQIDSILRVFDATGRELAVNDDATDPDSGEFWFDSALEFVAPAAGRFYIGVSGYANFTYNVVTGVGGSSSGSTGTYDLRTTLRRVASTPDVGDTIAAATTVTVDPAGTTVNERIGNNGFGSNDVDFYAVSLGSGDVLRLDIDAREIGLPGSLDSILRVFSAAGTQLSVNDDATDPDTGWRGLDSFIEFSAPSSGTYYVGVSGFANFNYSPTTANSGSGGSQGDYRLSFRTTASQPTTDAGDTISAARVVAVSASRTVAETEIVGNNAAGNSDVDMYAVTLNAGDILRLDVDAREIALPGGLDSILRVFNAAGVELAVNDDAVDPDTRVHSLDSALEFVASTAGTYYVGVSSFANFRYDPTVVNSGTGGSQGSFRLNFSLARPEPGSGDAGDTIATARPILVQSGQATTEAGTIGDNSFGNNDVDMYAVSLQAGAVLRLDIDAREIGLRGSLDSILRVFDAAGVQRAVNDDATDPDSGFEGLDSALEFTTPSAGTYYIGVSSFANFRYSATSANSGSGGSQGDYRLVVRVGSGVPTGDDIGDTIATARPIVVTPGGRSDVTESIGNNAFGNNDVDVYAVTLEAGDVVQLDIDAREIGLSTSLDTILRVFAADGTELAVNDDAADPDTNTQGLDSALEFTATAAGTYYVGVSSFANFRYSPTTVNSGIGGSRGTYRLTVHVDRPDSSADAGDTISTARPLIVQPGSATTVNDSIGNNARGNNDFDMFSVSLLHGDVLRLDIDAREISARGNLDSILRVFNASGSQVAVNDDGTDPDTGWRGVDSFIEFSVPSSGIYFVGVSSYANFNYNPFVETSGAGGSSQGDYRLTARVNRPVPVEVGDTMSTARQVLVQPGQPVAVNEAIGNNSPSTNNDVDMYAVSLTAGALLRLDIDAREIGLAGTLDSVVRLFSSTGAQLAINDDGTDPDTGWRGVDSALQYTVTSTGTYYVGVSSFANVGYNPAVANSGTGGSRGDYRLTMLVSAPPPPAEVGDTIATSRAIVVQPGQVVTVNERIGNNTPATPHDVDMYAITLQAGDVVTVDIDAREIGLAGNLDSVLRVFSSSGAQIAMNDDANDPETNWRGVDSALQFTAATSGTFYVGVSSFANTGYNPTVLNSGRGNSQGDYRLGVRVARPLPPSEVGDTIATARQVLVQGGAPTTISETIGNNSPSTSHDVDMFAVSLQAGNVLQIDVDAREIGLRGNLDSVLRVFNASGTELAINDDGADPDTGWRGVDSVIRFTAPAAGMYYVGVSSYANTRYSPTVANSGTGNSQGDYRLTFSLTSTPVPPPPAPGPSGRQQIWLNFNGGSARNGFSSAQNVPAFSSTVLGVSASQREALINRIVQFVVDDFVTSGSIQTPSTPLNFPVDIRRDFNPSLPGDQPPTSGPYQTVFIGGNGTAYGVAERVDVGNRFLDDNARVWSDAFASVVRNASFDQVAMAVASTISHEAGHNLGLSHVREHGWLMQTGELDNDRLDNERFSTSGTLYHTTGTQNDISILQAAFRSSADSADRIAGPVSVAAMVGDLAVREGVLVSNSDSLTFTIGAQAREVLRFDLDGRELADAGPRFTLTVYAPNGRVVASSQSGIDPETGYVGDPFVQLSASRAGVYRAVVTATYPAGSVPTEGEGRFFLSMQRLSPTVAARNPIGIGGRLASDAAKTLVVTGQQRQVNFQDASGDLVTISLPAGNAVVETRLVGGETNNANIASIYIRNADARASISISVTGSGGNRIPEILVEDDRIAGLTIDGFDVDRLVATGAVDRLSVLNGVVGESLAVAGNVGTLQMASPRGLPSGLAGALAIGGRTESLVVSAVQATATLRVGSVTTATFGSFSGGVFSASGPVGTLTFGQSATGTFTIAGNVTRFAVNGTLGTTVEHAGQIDVESPTSVSVRGSIRTLQITGSLHADVFASRGVRQRIVGVVSTSAAGRAADSVATLARASHAHPLAATFAAYSGETTPGPQRTTGAAFASLAFQRARRPSPGR